MNLGSTSTGGNGINWMFAGTFSLALHIVVLLLFVWSSGENEPQGARDAAREAPEAARVEETAKVEEKPKAKVEEKAKAKVEEKPKAKVEEKAKVAVEEKAVETYVVRKGDMLTHIAQDCKCTIQELARLNGTTARKLANLRVGQKIKVPRKSD